MPAAARTRLRDDFSGVMELMETAQEEPSPSPPAFVGHSGTGTTVPSDTELPEEHVEGGGGAAIPVGVGAKTATMAGFCAFPPWRLDEAKTQEECQFSLLGLCAVHSIVVELVVLLQKQANSPTGFPLVLEQRVAVLISLLKQTLDTVVSSPSAWTPPLIPEVELLRTEVTRIPLDGTEAVDTTFLVASARRIATYAKKATVEPTTAGKGRRFRNSPGFVFTLFFVQLLLLVGVCVTIALGVSTAAAFGLIAADILALLVAAVAFYSNVKRERSLRASYFDVFNSLGLLLSPGVPSSPAFASAGSGSYSVPYSGPVGDSPPNPFSVGAAPTANGRGVAPPPQVTGAAAERRESGGLLIPMELQFTNPLLAETSIEVTAAETPPRPQTVPENKLAPTGGAKGERRDLSIESKASLGDHLSAADHSSKSLSLPRQQSTSLLRHESSTALPQSFSMTLGPSGAFATPNDSTFVGDNITIFVPGFTQGVAFDVRSIHDRVIIIVTDLKQNVIYWNEGARMATGFTADDVANRNFANFVAAESSLTQLQRMREAATSQTRTSPKTLSLTSATFGVVLVRGSISPATCGTDLMGHVLIASEIEDTAQRTQAMLHQFVLEDLQREISLLIEHLPAEKNPVLLSGRVHALLEKMKWSHMNEAATAVNEWSKVAVQGILESTLRNRHQFIDVKVSPDVPVELICDVYVIGPALSNLMSGVAGKSRLEVGAKQSKYGFSQVCIWAHLGKNQRHSMSKIVAAAQRLTAVCGDCVEVRDGVAELTFPFLTDEAHVFPAGMQLGGSMSQTLQLTSVPKTDFPVTVLVVERSLVYRQNIILALMPMGHSFSWAETPVKALNLLELHSNEYSAIIVDIDQSRVEVEQLLSIVEEEYRHLLIILSSEHARPEALDSIDINDCKWLPKPINKDTVIDYADIASERAKERKAKEEVEKRQKEVFSTVRTLPWTKGKLLGAGAFASVFECQTTVTGGRMAVKMIRLKSQDPVEIERLVNEVRILTKLIHPNVITYLYCEEGQNTLNLFMELATQGTLANLLSRQGGTISESQMASITKQLLHAIGYLHEQGIIHRDIKPANVLISENNVIKLSDFGTATTQQLNSEVEGTLQYMAPEVLDQKSHGKACDIFSVGCVICECFGVKRFPGQIPTVEDLPASISYLGKQFIALCMKENADDRPSAGTLLLHDWIVEHTFGASMSLQRHASRSKFTATPNMDQWTVGTGGSSAGASDASSVATW